jgi:hypothetical protein
MLTPRTQVWTKLLAKFESTPINPLGFVSHDRISLAVVEGNHVRVRGPARPAPARSPLTLAAGGGSRTLCARRARRVLLDDRAGRQDAQHVRSAAGRQRGPQVVQQLRTAGTSAPARACSDGVWSDGVSRVRVLCIVPTLTGGMRARVVPADLLRRLKGHLPRLRPPQTAPQGAFSAHWRLRAGVTCVARSQSPSDDDSRTENELLGLSSVPLHQLRQKQEYHIWVRPPARPPHRALPNRSHTRARWGPQIPLDPPSEADRLAQQAGRGGGLSQVAKPNFGRVRVKVRWLPNDTPAGEFAFSLVQVRACACG